MQHVCTQMHTDVHTPLCISLSPPPISQHTLPTSTSLTYLSMNSSSFKNDGEVLLELGDDMCGWFGRLDLPAVGTEATLSGACSRWLEEESFVLRNGSKCSGTCSASRVKTCFVCTYYS